MEQFTRRMFARIISELARASNTGELTVAQFAALAVVDQDPGLRVTSLATTLGLSASAGSRLADGLVRRGLLARHEDGTDRRARALSLTARGRALVDRASERRVAVIFKTVAAMPPHLTAAIGAAVDRFRPKQDPPGVGG